MKYIRARSGDPGMPGVRSERGQLLPMFALALVALVLAAGIVVDERVRLLPAALDTERSRLRGDGGGPGSSVRS